MKVPRVVGDGLLVNLGSTPDGMEENQIILEESTTPIFGVEGIDGTIFPIVAQMALLLNMMIGTHHSSQKRPMQPTELSSER
jgi:hypothetical protein